MCHRWHPRGITEESRGIAKLLFLSDDSDLGFINGKTTKKMKFFLLFRQLNPDNSRHSRESVLFSGVP